MMRVVDGWPPNIDEIVVALPGAKTPGVIFCYGDTIYSPGGGKISGPLRAHEAIHSVRQGTTDESIRAWWKSYLSSVVFRYNEELPAHRAEYATFCEQERDKEKRFRYLVSLAKRLSSDIYGGLCTFQYAKLAIREGT